MYKIVLAAIAATTLPNSAFAGTVSVQTFGDGAPSKIEEEQGFPTSRHRQAVLLDATALPQELIPAVSSEYPTHQTLSEEFSALGSESQVERVDSSRPTGPSLRTLVPSWMRRGYPIRGGGTSRYFSSQQRTSLAYSSVGSTRACWGAEYRPKGLSAEVELRRARYFPAMASIACEYGLPIPLFDAVVTQESRYNPMAESPKGAVGLAQLMPATARANGVVNSWDPIENLRGGARVLKAHLDEFGRYDLALAAYNAGPGRVRGKGRVPQIRETVGYVSAILTDVRQQYQRAVSEVQ